MSFNPEEISKIIKHQIENYDNKLDISEVGNVISVGDGIALIYGLENAMASELLRFENGEYALALNLEENHVGAVLLSNTSDIKENDTVYRTGKIIEVPVGDMMLGRVVNALGQAIDGGSEIVSDTYAPIEKEAPGVMTRKSVHQSLETGIKVIDAIIPIGKGQRELIIGDRQTGKTAIAIDTIINQANKDVICVYVAIGQKASTLAQIVEKLKQHGAMKYTSVVFASASETAPLQYIAPYAGCSIAEYWMEQGKDVLIVYDDLSKHAVAYRTLSLLLRRPPGREAYPGDVFYLHSRLLERAAKLNEKYGGGSLTALPIIETQAGDISAYIPTNVISITDGQIFLQNELFNSGIRPAVDAGFSVSRVGSSAQYKAMKQVSSSLKLELAQFNELQAFSKFGSDLDASTKAVLDYGERLTRLLVQEQYKPLKFHQEVLSLFAIKHRFLNKVAVSDVSRYEKELHNYFDLKHNDIVEEINRERQLSEALNKKIYAAIEEFNQIFS